MPTAEAADPVPMDENDLRLLIGPASLTAQELAATYPAGVPIRLAAFVAQKKGLEQIEDAIRDFRFNATHVGESSSRQIHVLVIGETGRPDRWQLNGYSRPTTPRLSRIAEVVSFTDTVSAWAWTRMSVPVILTRKSPQDSRAFFQEKSLIAAFREAGFKTYWLSTQSPLGPHDSSIALHAREADYSRFLNPTDYRGAGVHDGVLLGPLSDILAQNEPRQLVVLHTLGSHFNYADRYPAGFDKFRPSQTGERAPSLHDSSQKEAMNNSYDNSIYYTDWLLSEIIERLRSTDSRATLLYVADHGENLFDGACTKSGHGHSTEFDFRVASMWWNSPQYGRARPDSIALVRERRDAALSTSHIFHTMLDAADIHYPGQDLSQSVLSANWTRRTRPVQGGYDFDASARDPVCLSLTRAPQRS
jgi:glucan phosphoethanolaminetransferase (alkaline phosphatase superfamily)